MDVAICFISFFHFSQQCCVVFNAQVCRSFVTFILKHFICYAILNSIYNVNLWLLLVCRNTIVLCMPILRPATLLKSLIGSPQNSLCRTSRCLWIKVACLLPLQTTCLLTSLSHLSAQWHLDPNAACWLRLWGWSDRRHWYGPSLLGWAGISHLGNYWVLFSAVIVTFCE